MVLSDTSGLEDQELTTVHSLSNRLNVVDKWVWKAGCVQPHPDPRMPIFN
ncbi:hypothetical protein GALL_470630 [mine drainage metagenome]|uniref:Uncharacterized protein n=1 Tax=mine drainage metagenome TaxID=410659 RepID=A0A1J5Q1G0_9ZZZZ